MNASHLSLEQLDKEVEDHKNGRTINYLLDIGMLREFKNMNMYQGGSLNKNNNFIKGESRVGKVDPSKDKYQILQGYENTYAKAPAGFNVVFFS